MTALLKQAAQVPADAAKDLEPRIRFSRSEGELGQVVEQIQAGFEIGHLSQAQAERLTYLAISTARQLNAGLVNVPVETLLKPP